MIGSTRRDNYLVARTVAAMQLAGFKTGIAVSFNRLGQFFRSDLKSGRTTR